MPSAKAPVNRILPSLIDASPWALLTARAPDRCISTTLAGKTSDFSYAASPIFLAASSHDTFHPHFSRPFKELSLVAEIPFELIKCTVLFLIIFKNREARFECSKTCLFSADAQLLLRKCARVVLNAVLCREKEGRRNSRYYRRIEPVFLPTSDLPLRLLLSMALFIQRLLGRNYARARRRPHSRIAFQVDLRIPACKTECITKAGAPQARRSAPPRAAVEAT